MAVLIRNTQTGRFYAGYNQWPFEPTDAFDFGETERASLWIRTVALDQVEVVRIPGNRLLGTEAGGNDAAD